jgi:PRTRC genetic system protein C
MALTPIIITRCFKFNGMNLTDPGPEMDLEAVKRIFAMQFPELLNSAIEGPTTKGAVSTYAFVRAVGAKGKGSAAALSVIDTIKQMGQGNQDSSSLFFGMTETEIKESVVCSTVLKTVVNSKLAKHPLPLTQQSFGIWG